MSDNCETCELWAQGWRGILDRAWDRYLNPPMPPERTVWWAPPGTIVPTDLRKMGHNDGWTRLGLAREIR